MTGAREATISRNLQLRILTAAVGLPLLLVVTLLGGWAFALCAGLIAVVASAEFSHGWLLPSQPVWRVWPLWTLFAWPGVMVAGVHWDDRMLVAGIVLAAMMAAVGYAPTHAFGPRKPYRVQAAALLYIGLLFSTVVLVRDLDGGRDWILIGLLASFAVDTGAYAVGKLVGRHKLAPTISPGKTVEGAAGGYVAGAAAVVGLNALFGTGVSAVTVAPLAILLPIAAEGGDLFESWMKRRMGVKDASGLLPGHGGLLDRMDSVLFVMPLVYVFNRIWVT